MSENSKRETIYIDVEDDVTSVVEKVRSAKAKVVALVVPKRSTTLQSAVNVKLIKRAATSSKKAVVLITSDETMRAIAASVGLHVAKTLQSKPEIPSLVDIADADLDGNAPVGDLENKDSIEIDNSSDAQATEKPMNAKKDNAKASLLAGLKSPKIKIPNFESFRKKLIMGGGLLVLIIGLWIWAAIVLPKAEIIISTNTSIIDTETMFTADTETTEFDEENKIVPAYTKEVQKIESESVKATGTRDEGKKATGKLTLTNCIFDGESYTIPAGTGFSSSGNQTFVTNIDVTLPPAVYAGPNNCVSAANGLSQDVGVTAIEGGEKYNVKAQAYDPPAAYETGNGSIQAEGSKMSGGTTKIVTFVSKSDVEAATQAVIDKVEPQATEELKSQFNSDQAIVLADTFKDNDPETTSVPKIGEEVEGGDQAKVTVKITYQQSGIKKEYLTKLIEAAAKNNVDESTQVIQNTGLDNAEIIITDTPSDSETKIRMLSTVVAGPQLDEASIKESIAGEKKARTREIIQQRPGITGVEVNYSPFWVINTPENPEKVTIIFQQANGN